MKTILYTLFVGLPLSGLGQVTTPEAQQLVELKSDAIVDFEYDGQFVYVLNQNDEKATLSVFKENALLDEYALASRSAELGKRCDGKIVVYQETSHPSVIHVDEKSRITLDSYGPLNYDCFENREQENRAVLVGSNGSEKTVALFTHGAWDTLTIAYQEELNPSIKNPGKTANLSGSSRSNIHDRSVPLRTTYPTPRGEYSEPETRVLHEGSMENIRREQYRNGAMNMETTTLEALCYLVNDTLVVINSTRDKMNSYTLSGELIASNEIKIPRPVVWSKINEEYLLDGTTQQLFFLSQNSSGTQFYLFDISTGVGTPIFKEKKATKLMLVKPSSEGVAYLVKNKGTIELKFAAL